MHHDVGPGAARVAAVPAADTTADEAPSSPVREAAPPHKDAAEASSLEPITESQAFEKIGGDEALKKCAHIRCKVVNFTTDSELDEETKRLLPRDFRKRTGFSTKLINQPYVRDLESLYKRAESAKNGFDRIIHEIALATGGNALIPPIKGQQRARMKANFKYCDKNGGIAWYRLSDIVRATIAYPDILLMYEGLEVVVQRFGI